MSTQLEVISPTIKKCSFEVSTDSFNGSYTLFINHLSTLPAGIFVWDYFASGELWVNFSHANLTSANTTLFSQIYKSYFLNSGLLSKEPTYAGHSPLDFVTSYQVYSDGTYGWAIPLDPFFEYERVVVSHPVCSYYSVNNSSYKHLSEHYNFANIPSDTTCCSHPSVASFTPCKAAIQNNCSLYQSKTDVLATSTVSYLNSHTSLLFNLEYYLSFDLYHTFVINNVTQSATLNTLIYPLDNDYDSLLQEALSIFDDYISSYSSLGTSSLAIPTASSPDPVDKNSYVLSLIGD